MKKYIDNDRYCRHCGRKFTRQLQAVDTCFECEQKGHNWKNGAICALCEEGRGLGSRDSEKGLTEPLNA